MSIRWVELSEDQFDRKGHSNMLTESLGVSTQGCRCQNVLVVLIENGELIDLEQQSDYPVHLRERTEEWKQKNLVQRNGKWYLKEKASHYCCLGDNLIKEVIDGEEYVLDDMRIAEVDGEMMEIDPCCQYSETCFEDDLSELPDGMYLVLLENACWSEYSWEYGCYEGDGEYEVALISAIPLNYKGMFEPASS
jgi:hypothetical protein